MLFDWLVTGQVMPSNPAYSVRGPRHSVSKRSILGSTLGSTPVLSSEEATALLTGMDSRVVAVVALSVEDYFPQEKRWWLRLCEKNGKVNEMPCHHKFEDYLDAYIKSASIAHDRKGSLFRAAIGKTKKLGPGAVSRTDVWYMVRRRDSDAGIETAIGCHTFRAKGITDYVTNGGRIEVRATHGRALERENDRALRPAER